MGDAKKSGPGAPAKPGGDVAMAQTVLGMPAATGDGAPMAKPAGSAPAQPAAAAKPTPMEEKRTVLGMAAVDTSNLSAKKPAKTPLAKPSTPPPPADGVAGDAKTVLGMAAVDTSNLSAKKPSKPPLAKMSTQGSRGAPSAGTAPTPVAGDKKTMLGMPAATGEQPKQEEPRTTQPVPDRDVRSAPAASPRLDTPAERPASRAGSDHPTAALTSRHDDWPDEQPPAQGRSVAGIAVIVAAVVVIVAGIVAVGYLLLTGSGSSLKPRIYPTADGQAVTVSFALPEAPPGSAMQIMGQTVPVKNGQASLDVKLSQLSLGVNELPATYLEPNKPGEALSFSIVLRHSVTTDLAGLATEEPFVQIEFKVAPEVQLAVEGKPVQLAAGSYVHRLPLARLLESAKQSGDNLIHNVPFQLIDNDGAVEQGQQVIAVPLTELQVNRPAKEAAVATESVTCAGTTEEGAQVTVNGEPVGVTAAGFNTTVALPALGEHKIEVKARAPGKAPTSTAVTVTRIESLDSAIEDWSSDLDGKLDYPTLGRDPNAHIDKKIKLNGRVVNINTQKGVTAFLLYIAEGCPKAARCAVYVVFRGETEAGLHSWVDVYGKVKGTRAVDLPSGKKLTVPSVQAEFVIKSDPEAGGRKKRRRR